MSLPQVDLTKYDCHQVYSAKQVLENEGLVAEKQQLAMFTLMSRAGKAAFNELNTYWPEAKHVLLLCGKGNNGGDGFIVARLAHMADIKVTVLLTCQPDQITGDAKTAYEMMLDVGVKQVFTEQLLEHITSFRGDVIVDALFGIGFYGALTETALEWVNAVNTNIAPVLSVDTPSGLCATSGFVCDNNAIIADVTVTFIVYKQGLLTGSAADCVGELILADLALGKAFKEQVASHCYYQCPINKKHIASPLLKRRPTSHKGSVGQVLAIGGFVGMPGAIRLASEAALRVGAALVSIACHQDNQALVFQGRPELMLAPNNAKKLSCSPVQSKAKVTLLGPGLGQAEWSQEHFDLQMNFIQQSNYQKPMVIDADGLTLLAKNPQHYSRWILTPHPKEAAALLNCDVATIEADRFAAVRAIAQKYGGICVLKGAGSLVSDGERVVINSSGNAGMASGGMGDVLSGIVAGLILQADDYFLAVCFAVYIHGAAGDIIASQYGQRGMLASDLFNPLRQLTNQI